MTSKKCWSEKAWLAQGWLYTNSVYVYHELAVCSPLRSSLNFSPEIEQVIGVVSMVTGSLLCNLSCTHGSPMS